MRPSHTHNKKKIDFILFRTRAMIKEQEQKKGKDNKSNIYIFLTLKK